MQAGIANGSISNLSATCPPHPTSWPSHSAKVQMPSLFAIFGMHALPAKAPLFLTPCAGPPARAWRTTVASPRTTKGYSGAGRMTRMRQQT
jgi:hypothetical protein